MSLEQLKDQAAHLQRAEQRELIAFLVARQTAEDEKFKEKLARKIDESDPANWMTFEEMEKRYAEQPSAVEYRLLVAFEVIEILDALPVSVRKNLRTQIGRLRFAPEQLSDYGEFDCTGRPVEVNVFAGYCVRFWIDSADRHVKAVEITLADS